MIQPAIPALTVKKLTEQKHFNFEFPTVRFDLCPFVDGFAILLAKRLKKDPGVLTPELYLIMFESAIGELPTMTVDKMVAEGYLDEANRSHWRYTENRRLLNLIGYKEQDYKTLRHFYREIAEALFPGHTAFAEAVGKLAQEIFSAPETSKEA